MADQTELENVQQKYEELVAFVAERLLGTDDFKVTSDVRKGQILLKLAAPEDLRGRVIGRGGRIARSIRTMLEAAAIPTHLQPTLDIVD